MPERVWPQIRLYTASNQAIGPKSGSLENISFDVVFWDKDLILGVQIIQHALLTCVASLVLRSSSVTFAPRAKSAINSTWQDSSYRVGTDQNTISRVAHWIGNLIWKCFVSKICPLGNRSPDFGPMPGGHPAGAIVSDTQLGLCLRRTSPTASRGGPLRPLRTSGASGLTPFPLFSSFFFETQILFVLWQWSLWDQPE